MIPDEDLPTLIRQKKHLDILRFIRAHALREPKLVVDHGRALLGKDLSRKLGDQSVQLAVLEQICLAAIDLQDHVLAEACLTKLRGFVSKDSFRFRRLVGRCLESAGEVQDAHRVYDQLLQENPSNLVALKRKYCLLQAQTGKEVEAMEALNAYLEQNMADTAAWYELANRRLELGDYQGAAYALEEVILASPLESSLHCLLAEVYATIGGLENLKLARKHTSNHL